MAEEQKNNGTQNVAKAANTAKDGAKLAKDTGRLAAGDVTAVKDLLFNELLWKILLVIALIISLMGMTLGASFTGVINYTAQSWEENWNENWEEAAIESGGDATYLKTYGWLMTLGNTVTDFITDAFGTVTSQGIAAGTGTIDNQQITDSAITAVGRNPVESDYLTTLQAIMDSAKLDQALTDRLDMIKSRVEQRGLQIQAAVYEQYMGGRKSEYDKIVEAIIDDCGDSCQMDDNGTAIFYAGYSEELSEANFTFDMTPFELTDLQALKILAIFSVQNDCQLSEVDMWSLMDYCGWYDSSLEGEMYDIPDTIYEVVEQTQTYGTDIGTSVTAGQGIPIATYEFPALRVPIWSGSCAPQWYYEELAQIRALTNSSSEDIQIERYSKLSEVETYGIIDRLFYSAENHLTVNRSEYSSADDWSREEIAAISDKVYAYWDKYIWSCDKVTITGSTVTRDDDGNHSYTYAGEIPSKTTKKTTNKFTGVTTTTFTVYSIALYDSNGNLVETKTKASDTLTFTGLQGDTTYTLYEVATSNTIKIKNGEVISDKTDTSKTILDLFTTFKESSSAMAYQIYVSVDLSFKARTVDELAFDLLGIWPGSLLDTTQVVRTTQEGNLIGKTSGSEEQYSYCLSGGTFSLQRHTGGSFDAPSGEYMTLKRATSATIETKPFTTLKTTYQYGITDRNGLASINSIPKSGWRSVDADGDHLIFEIDGNTQYLVYAKVTYTREVLNSDGTTTVTSGTYLYLIDAICPKTGTRGYAADTKISNGDVYAAGYLGNENLLLNWSDTYELSKNGRNQVLNFTRMSGYQYETYVDMAMALCELMDIPYSEWDAALQRAQELHLPQ